MARPSHSRFIDEVFSTAAPSTSSIEVKKTEQLIDEIFSSNFYEDFQAGLIAAEELNSKDLYEKYPPKFNEKNKQLVFDLLNAQTPYSPASNKSILITRWKPFVPFIESTQPVSPQVKFHADVFQYQSNQNNQSIEWHLNFANSDLFAYYRGPLLAQDELQVLECVELGALREYLVRTTNSVGSRTVGSDADTNLIVPTPILISNTERVINLDTSEIYGNAFARASDDQIRKAFSRNPFQIVNLIAIEAPSYGEGRYTYEKVRYILTACYTGFKAAQILAKKTHAMNTASPSTESFRTIIHTGWWGCGAYGNNRQMMLITQMLAAHWAQVDEIHFHVQNFDHKEDIEKSQEIFEQLKEKKEVEQVIENILQLNLEWEQSNNT